eukprot:TRINITY_DN6134_c0_g1_i1.p1 TRINITY_DN6134_c0_g1~~TRINITY_DN6134_c0_g1_i1.p1  ORF type:complete len:418 (+),score=144.00 TRINITY_DN6134_c0_g1_i1:282-1535(+)
MGRRGVFLVLSLLLFSFFFVHPASSDSSSSARVHTMSPDVVKDIGDGSLFEDVFCFSGMEPAFYYFWSSAVVKLRIDPGAEYSIYYGDNATAVLESISLSKASWFYTNLPWKSKDFKVHPFRASCLGVLTDEPFSMLLRFYRINYWQVCMTALGIAGFLWASNLSRNAFFHYATTVTVGVLFSFLALTYFFQRRLRLGWSSWILALYSISLYFLTSIISQAQAYIIQHHLLVISYVAVTAILSAGMTYRFGPVSNPRTLNLIQWALQGLSLGLIYLSSYYQSLSFSLCLILMASRFFSLSWLTSQYRRRFYKPNLRLLSESEYMDQSRIETEKALQELRDYCNSPNCKPWKTMRVLASPSRFAEFMDGGSHLSPDEIIDYSHAVYDEESSYLGGSNQGSLTDDDDDDSEGVIDLGED